MAMVVEMPDCIDKNDDDYMPDDTLSSSGSDVDIDTGMESMDLDDEDSATDEDYEYEEPATKEEMKELRHELKKELKALSPLNSAKWLKRIRDIPDDVMPLDHVEPATYHLFDPLAEWEKLPSEDTNMELSTTLRIFNDPASRKLWRKHASLYELPGEDLIPPIPDCRLLTHVHLDIGLSPEIRLKPVLAAILEQLKLGIFLQHLTIHLRQCQTAPRSLYIPELISDLHQWDHDDVQCRSVVEITSDFTDAGVRAAVQWAADVDAQRVKELEEYFAGAAKAKEEESNSDVSSIASDVSSSDSDDECDEKHENHEKRCGSWHLV